MILKKWVVLFEHPHYPEIFLFDNEEEAIEMQNYLIKENHVEDGHHEGFVYCGLLDGIFTTVKTFY